MLDNQQMYDDLARDKPKSMEDLMKHVEGWSQLYESKVQRGMGKGVAARCVIVLVVHAPSPHTPNPKKQVNNIKIAPTTGPRPRDFAVEKIVFTMPIYKIMDEIKDKPYFSFPNQKLRMENGKVKSERVRCSSHNETGHFTTSCNPFKSYLEQLVAARHLGNLIN